MFQVIFQWNLLDAKNIIEESKPSDNLRGYDKNTILTSEWLTPLKTGEIRKLSVSDIADIKCPIRRDLYYKKGKNRPRQRSQSPTWGSRAGPIVEKYFLDYLSNNSKFSSKNYGSITQKADTIHEKFLSEQEENFKKLEGEEQNGSTVDTEWLKKLLNCGGRAELGLKILNSVLKNKTSLQSPHILQGIQLMPNIEIGINAPSTPDFIIPDHSIVGDIKSGKEFQGIHQLTCAGYALAYENSKKNVGKADINWGIIYFFPTRNHLARIKPITFPQLYIFPIDDILRTWFLDKRDEAYRIISKDAPPDFPQTKNQCQFCNPCLSCKYQILCKKDGLEIP
jgi:CRISPR/Cas system-associated exonuclease Cas4 (RecB family)